MGRGIVNRRGFAVLSVIAVIDASSRSGFLLLAPFLMVGKGLPVEHVGFAVMLVFAGGAAGKPACGFIAERLGTIRTIVVTEVATALGIAAAIALPMGWLWVLLAPLGLVLNGTSSVLYGAAGELAHEGRQAPVSGPFRTVTTAASAAAPIAFGVLADATDPAGRRGRRRGVGGGRGCRSVHDRPRFRVGESPGNRTAVADRP